MPTFDGPTRWVGGGYYVGCGCAGDLEGGECPKHSQCPYKFISVLPQGGAALTLVLQPGTLHSLQLQVLQ